MIQVGPKKSLRIVLEEKYLRNSNIFLDRVFLSIYVFSSSQEVRAVCYVEKKLWGSKNPENILFKKVTLLFYFCCNFKTKLE